MSKPTARQEKILEAMRNGAKLVLIKSFNPSAYLWSETNFCPVKVTVNDPYNLERKGLIEVSKEAWNSTSYRVKEPK